MADTLEMFAAPLVQSLALRGNSVSAGSRSAHHLPPWTLLRHGREWSPSPRWTTTFGGTGFSPRYPKSHTPDLRGHHFGASLDEVNGLLHGLIGIPT
jgi:hypothetical protein